MNETTATKTNQADPNSSFSSSKEIDENVLERIFRQRLCRICRSDEKNENKFMIACKCIGPFAYVHKRCMENWIETTFQFKCDICRFRFNIISRKRGLIEWLSTKYDSDYLRPMLELLTRFFNALFISLIGILIVKYCEDFKCNLKYSFPSSLKQKILRSLIIAIIPTFRLCSILYLVIWHFVRVIKEFRVWQKKTPKIEVLPFSKPPPSEDKSSSASSPPSKTTSTTKNMQTIRPNSLVNSFVRVSGFKQIKQFMQATAKNDKQQKPNQKQEQEKQQKQQQTLIEENKKEN